MRDFININRIDSLLLEGKLARGAFRCGEACCIAAELRDCRRTSFGVRASSTMESCAVKYVSSVCTELAWDMNDAVSFKSVSRWSDVGGIGNSERLNDRGIPAFCDAVLSVTSASVPSVIYLETLGLPGIIGRAEKDRRCFRGGNGES